MPATKKRKIGLKELRLLVEIAARTDQANDLYLIAPQDWHHWHAAIFGTGEAPLADHHCELWEWVWSIERGERVAPFVGIWARGGAKSTNAERAVVALGARGKRNYCVYVSETQEQADRHVESIQAIIEGSSVQKHYADFGQRNVGKYGASKGWRRSRLRTASGFTVDSLGLDTAARGIKVDEYRPDLIVLDDIDSEKDSTEATAKKIETITKKILPAGSSDAVVLFMQNQITEDSIASQLIDDRARFLIDRIVSGPHKAIVNLETEKETLPNGRIRDIIVGGTPTWRGQGYAECQQIIDRDGLDAFLAESQHEVGMPLGGLFDGVEYRHCKSSEVPDLVVVEAAVDPAVTSTDKSDSHGLTIGGIAEDGTVYILWSWEQQSTPDESIKLAINRGMHFGATTITVETDQGGDLWEESYNRIADEKARDDEQEWRAAHERMSADIAKRTGPYQAARIPGFNSARAGSIGSKVHRANMLLQAYKRGEIVHVINNARTHILLEKALRRFPKRKPFDLVDSEFWLWHRLTEGNYSGAGVW